MTMLKHLWKILLIAVVAQSVFAFQFPGMGGPPKGDMGQPGMGQGPSGRGRGPGHGPATMDPDQQLKRMTEEFGLTSDQQAKIKPILENQHSKLMELHKSTSDQIRSILTEDQQKKMDQMNERMNDQMNERRKESHPGPADSWL